MLHETYVVILVVWHSVGQLLLGIFVGSYLSRSGQRKQWLWDSKKAEYRELLTALSQSTHTILKDWAVPGYAGLTLRSGEQERAAFEARSEGLRVIADRIFISQRIQKDKIRERWEQLIQEGDLIKFHAGTTELHGAVVKAALEDLGV